VRNEFKEIPFAARGSLVGATLLLGLLETFEEVVEEDFWLRTLLLFRVLEGRRMRRELGWRFDGVTALSSAKRVPRKLPKKTPLLSWWV
jgi:hypothetical protein